MNEYRCPKCGSLEVGVDFARSVFENKWMTCYACSYGSYATWDDQAEWLIEDQDRAAASAPPVCGRCTSDDAAVAYYALDDVHVTTLIDEVHFGIDLKACACGRHAASLFAERVADDGDSQTWLVLPLSDDEVMAVRREPRDTVPTLLVELGRDRRYLVRSNWNPAPWWVDGGFSIPPHH